MEFEVGQLVLHSSMQTDGVLWKGMVKAVNLFDQPVGVSITVFWFHDGSTLAFPRTNLRPLRAA